MRYRNAFIIAIKPRKTQCANTNVTYKTSMDIPDTTNVHQLPEIKQEDPGEAARLSAFMAEESDVN